MIMNVIPISEDGATRKPDSSSSFGLVHPNGTNFTYTDIAPGITLPLVTAFMLG